jgi:hypothetical protein
MDPFKEEFKLFQGRLRKRVPKVLYLRYFPPSASLGLFSPKAMNNFTKTSYDENAAGGVASLRALCSFESDRRLRINDPYAVLFVESEISHLRSYILVHFVT